MAILLKLFLVIILRGDFQVDGHIYRNYKTWVFFRTSQISWLLCWFPQKVDNFKDILRGIDTYFP